MAKNLVKLSSKTFFRTPVLFHMQGDPMEGDSPRLLVRPHKGCVSNRVPVCDILVPVRTGSGSADPYHGLTEVLLFLSVTFKMATKIVYFLSFFALITFKDQYIYIIL
jgi:hypothetical protein